MQHNKKLLSAAVAGAFLAAPAMVAAQTSTVQIQGSMNILYYIVNPNNDVAPPAAPGKKGDLLENSENNIRVSGEENLGGGLSIWFQCESSTDTVGNTAIGLCTRNSGTGFKSNWGNVFFGNWDTPLKLTYGVNRGWFSATNGLYGGSGHLLFGGTANGANPAAPAGTNGSFFRRQANQVSYHSPSWNGFNVKASYSAGNEHTGLGLSPLNPRLWSATGEYANGPMFVNLGFERHQDYNPGAIASSTVYSGGDDDKWMIGGGYTFANSLRLSGLYTESKYDVTNSTDMKVKGFAVYADWKIQGPHSVRAQYSKVDDTKGSSTTAVGRYAAPIVAGAAPGSSGADHYTLVYAYTFSKRTSVGLAYNHMSNDARANFSLGKATASLGGNQSHYGMFINHRF